LADKTKGAFMVDGAGSLLFEICGLILCKSGGFRRAEKSFNEIFENVAKKTRQSMPSLLYSQLVFENAPIAQLDRVSDYESDG
jgi:hypothetical protein